jgi:hypothetical protein
VAVEGEIVNPAAQNAKPSEQNSPYVVSRPAEHQREHAVIGKLDVESRRSKSVPLPEDPSDAAKMRVESDGNERYGE